MILTRIKLWLGAAVAGLVAILAALVAMQSNRALRAKIEPLRDYQKTREVMDDADNDIHGDDPAAARRFLSERAKRGGDL